MEAQVIRKVEQHTFETIVYTINESTSHYGTSDWISEQLYEWKKDFQILISGFLFVSRMLPCHHGAQHLLSTTNLPIPFLTGFCSTNTNVNINVKSLTNVHKPDINNPRTKRREIVLE